MIQMAVCFVASRAFANIKQQFMEVQREVLNRVLCL